MKGFDCAVFRYRLPLRAPLRLPGVTLHTREGLLLRMTDRRGVSGWGEAAPLPGFSVENIETAAAELEEVCHSEEYTRERKDGQWSPSVAFALFGVTWNYTCAYHPLGNTAGSMHPDHDPVIQVQALLAGNDDTIAAKAQAMGQSPEGCRTAKLKVGDAGPDAAAGRVATVMKHLGPGWNLRIDANRAWGFDEAEAFWNQAREWPIEYVEEPLADWTRLSELHTKCGIPYALDETLREAGPVGRDILEGASGLVHKPTMMRLEDMPEIDEEIPLCVSASFESGVGMAAAAGLAFVFDPDQPAGLDTYSWLAEDVLEERLPLAPGLVNIEDLADAARRVDMSKLERIV